MPCGRQVVVSLGSNQGDRRAHLQHAVTRLGDLLSRLRVSTFIETVPVGVARQPLYLNGIVVGWSAADPHALLQSLQAIEAERGRLRPFAGAPRTLDLDLILVGGEVVASPELTLPHPLFRERRFVLEPLCEIAPETSDPITQLTARECLERLAAGDCRCGDGVLLPVEGTTSEST